MKQLENNIQEEKEQLKKRIKTQPKIKQIVEPSFNGGIIGWFEKCLFLINNYGFKKILQSVILIGISITFFLIFDAIKEENLIKDIIIYGNDSHSVASEVRKEVDTKITKNH